ncbi:MAG: histidine phosphatase family protein [Candidatus Doudnabacteria bacterium]|nr:histidine phosphatase family protein [Candidatus Doudnabacteria bacterium]
MPEFKQFDQGPTDQEIQKERPALTVYVLRHGESEADKSKPNRGLTEHGQSQVRESMQAIINQLGAELPNITFHLRDSGTERTQQQVQLEREILLAAGVPAEHIILPKFGIAKRLKGVQGMDQNPEFRKKLKSEEYQQKVGAGGDMEAWALSPDDELPEGIESRAHMEARYKKDLAKVENLIHRGMVSPDQRVVAIANSHSSIITLAAASELGVPVDQLMKKLGEIGPEREVAGAQGLKYEFYAGGPHQATPFGREIEQAAEEM